LITIRLDDDEVSEALAKLAKATGDTRSILDQIGDYMLDSTRRRFGTSTAPDGKRWAPNSQVTILEHLRLKSGIYEGSRKRIGTKDGFFYKKGEKKNKLAAKGIATVLDKRPLIGEGDLARQFFKRIDSSGTLIIGSTVEYSAAQQFGMKKGYAGTNKRGSPIPWGDIPARPFLGISDQDRTNILDTVFEYLSKSFRP
jgi:phage gpG-like protein